MATCKMAIINPTIDPRVSKLLDSYNQSGKSTPIPDDWKPYIGSATPDESKEKAVIPYWDDP